MDSWLKMEQTQQKPKWTNKEQVIKNSNKGPLKSLILMVEQLKAPMMMSAYSAPSPCVFGSCNLLWIYVYLRKATK